MPDCVRAWSIGATVPLRNPMATRPWQHVLEPLSGYLALAMALKDDPSLHGQPFNFGPSTQHNYSVGELVSGMANYWDKVLWADVSAQYGGPYESGLLKLNCDKALHYLKWHAVWGFDSTVSETIGWYRQYYDNPGLSIVDFSLNQIDAYVRSAQKQGLSWVQ